MEGLSLTAIGLGLIIIGAAYGISRLASSALESMARQPEISSKIQTAMIIAAALIEGVALFAIVVALMKG
ncbi:ATP synthase F0 subunit C [Carboxylicivirga linearis]|uniref:ATP synthase subunit c n=1 Tax=Carboxylicivirga linearis TaxID=1628157 RepID=A0ABS5JQ21_9BACT|nr:ATP synthase F0 subunit C [Carboxylicivirga linearis]MBS2096935.1 ATP synthase F0 subunit C [Carboxylicivirga linearis]